uniref:hypothetical protein n=1 Tax=Trichocoleus desertorum TaxID=1481672 RepID=UPI0025B4DAFC|nr:hypothetical protein [Trichocoleus desertorum]
MNKLTKSELTAFGLTCLSLGMLPTNPAQAALLNFNLSFLEDSSGRTGAGTLQIDDSQELGSGFFEITEFQVLTPQNKSLALSNYAPAGPDFVLGFNQTLGSIAQVNQADPTFIFSPFIIEAPGSFLFFERFEKRYVEDLFFSSETRGLFTAELVSPEPPPTEVPEPGVWVGSLVAMMMAYKLKRSCPEVVKISSPG